MPKEDYDKRYAKKGFYWGLQPHSLVIETAKLLPKSARVLDLGCGEGKDAFYLTKKGFRVTAIDVSREGIAKLERFAREKRLKIETAVSDAEAFLKTSGDFDAIIGINLLQFISQERIKQLIESLNSKVKPSGLVAIASFIAENPQQRERALRAGRYLFQEGELREIYKDWKIIKYEEVLGNWETHGEPKHRHYKVLLIAQKH